MKQTISHFTNPWRAIHIAVMLVSSASVTHLGAQVIVDPTAQADSLAATNGNNVAAGGSGLHAVYVKAGAIYYTWSGNGQTWNAGVAITGSGVSQPAIAVASNGTVGIVYRDGGGSVLYQSCKPAKGNLPWRNST